MVAIITFNGCRPVPSRNDLEALVLAQQPTFALVAESIEKYHLSNGIYPLSIEEIKGHGVPSIALPERFKSLSAPPLRYEAARDRSFFRLTYGIHDADDYELHAGMSYLSLTKEWKLNDNRGLLSHVEATHYGEQYKKTLSNEYLTLAVQSLLDSAKANSAYPCRNFWKDWVVNAIGTGQPMERRLPLLAGINGATMYNTDNGRAAYAFAFQSELYPPMTTPLMIATAVYQTTNGGKDWALVQHCDSSN